MIFSQTGQKSIIWDYHNVTIHITEEVKNKSLKGIYISRRAISLRKTGKIIFTTIILVCITVGSMAATALSQSKGATKEERAYLDVIESEYIKNVKAALEKEGYHNSGITMTKIIKGEEGRNYTVTIHNEQINKLSEEKQQALRIQLSKISFPEKGDRFSHEFLVL